MESPPPGQPREPAASLHWVSKPKSQTLLSRLTMSGTRSTGQGPSRRNAGGRLPPHATIYGLLDERGPAEFLPLPSRPLRLDDRLLPTI